MDVKKIFAGIAAAFLFQLSIAAPKPAKEIYEVRIYTMKNMQQVAAVDMFLKDVYLPTLHQSGIKNVGVFKVIGIDTAVAKKIYVISAYSSLDKWQKINSYVTTNKNVLAASSSFVNAAADKAPYERMELILTEAFPKHPLLEVPVLKSAKEQRVYELRSYESPTEHLYERKVTMFNAGDEVGLFKRLNFNAIFYSSVIAGPKMPNLMYMISFENMADHDDHWKQFVNDWQWKKISTMPEYENKVSVSHIDSILMHPTDYSDL
jgi:hypothetical protein